MARNFYTEIQTEQGPVLVHVNRRGCKGRGTNADQAALAELTRAVAESGFMKPLAPDPENTTPPAG